MAERELDITLSEDDLERVKREAVRRGISLEQMTGILTRTELARRTQALTSTGSVVPFRRRTD